MQSDVRVRAVQPSRNSLEASYGRRRLWTLDPGARPRARVQLLTGFRNVAPDVRGAYARWPTGIAVLMYAGCWKRADAACRCLG
jgi:hypothetical protein